MRTASSSSGEETVSCSISERSASIFSIIMLYTYPLISSTKIHFLLLFRVVFGERFVIRTGQPAIKIRTFVIIKLFAVKDD